MNPLPSVGLKKELYLTETMNVIPSPNSVSHTITIQLQIATQT